MKSDSSPNMRSLPLFSVTHLLSNLWNSPLRFSLYIIIAMIVSYVLIIFFPRSGSAVYMFLLTLSLIPFIFFITAQLKNVWDLKKWWKHMLLMIIVIMVVFSVFVSTTSIHNLDKKFGTPWKELEGLGVDRQPYASPYTFKKVLLNNWGILVKILLLSILTGTAGLFLTIYTTTAFSVFITSFIMAKKAVFIAGKGLMLILFLGIMYLPHTILEILAYILAGIAGTKLVQAVLADPSHWKSGLEKALPVFFFTLALAIVIVLIAAVFEAFIDPALAGMVFQKEFVFEMPVDPLSLIQ